MGSGVPTGPRGGTHRDRGPNIPTQSERANERTNEKTSGKNDKFEWEGSVLRTEEKYQCDREQSGKLTVNLKQTKDPSLYHNPGPFPRRLVQ